MQEDPAKLELLHEMPLSRVVTHEGENDLSGMDDALINFHFFQILHQNPNSNREWSPAVT